MSKPKKDVRFNVVSMRVSDEEKLALEEMMRNSRTTMSDLIRQAVQCYSSMFENSVNQG